MKNLVLINHNFNGQIISAVHARDLHAELESKKDFTDWIKARILKYGFIEGEDYVLLLPQMGEQKGRGGSNKTDYILSLDMAKEVAMVEATEKGREVRQYFIRREKQLRRLEKQQFNLEWQQARSEGKLTRREETDTIKAFIDYAKARGSTHADNYYMLITKGTYKALFILETETSWKGLRERLSEMQLTTLATAEQIAQKYMREGMEMNMPYKDIYKYCIAKVEAFADIFGKNQISTNTIKAIR